MADQTVKPIAGLFQKYKKIVPSPLAQAAGLFALSIPVAYIGRNIVNNQALNLAKDRRIAAASGLTPAEMEKAVKDQQNTFRNKHGIPLALASILPIASLAVNTDLDAPFFGWHTWDLMKKHQSLRKNASLWESQGYQPKLDFAQPINSHQVQRMFATNPYISADPYARNLGTSIIAAAPSFGSTTTLGNIYDSALNKFDKKLDFQGLAGKAIKGTIAGGLAGMFTDTVGTIFGFQDPLRTSLANSAGVGTALLSILT